MYVSDIDAETVRLARDADLEHEDARDWYCGYGAHVSTEDAGDVTIQSVEYDWLDDADDAAVARRLRREYSRPLTRDEAMALVEMARGVWEAAEEVEGLLCEAVACYEAGDLAGVIDALRRADAAESAHGDSPATQSLADDLLEEVAD